MRKAHPKYKRVMKSNKKFYAHDEQNSARVGDVVRIRETRPLSKLKRWSLEEIVRRSSLAQIEDEKKRRKPSRAKYFGLPVSKL
jgi:small subunit ribosomal protein S17